MAMQYTRFTGVTEFLLKMHGISASEFSLGEKQEIRWKLRVKGFKFRQISGLLDEKRVPNEKMEM